MQTAAQQASQGTAICPVCNGKKYVMKRSERPRAIKTKCYQCRGTGQTSPGYTSK